MTMSFAAAVAAARSVSNAIPATFGPLSNAVPIIGWHVWDANAAGNMLAYGTFNVYQTPEAGDLIGVPAGGINITLGGAISQYAGKAVLDWLLGGAAASRPTVRHVSFASGTPTEAGASDGRFTNAAGVRQTVTMAAANSPQNSATNLGALSATVSGQAAAGTVLGYNIWDAAAAGNRLAFGGIAAIGAKSTDSVSFPVGSLKITLT
jgi:hypothetical protein